MTFGAGARPFAPARARFEIGLAPLDLADWLEIGPDLAEVLQEKDRLLASRHGDVFAALPGSESAQAETLALVRAWLGERACATHRVTPDAVTAAGRTVHTDGHDGLAPLDAAGRLVPEDLCLLEAGEGGYRLTAASLCAPAHWRLHEKLGHPMMGIHAPVPGWSDRLGPRVDRIFANLKVEAPVQRLNWGLAASPVTFTPEARRDDDRRMAHLTAGDAIDALWLRVERQTLRRLARTGAILFTIRTVMTPLAEVLAGQEDVRALLEALETLGADEQRYKAFGRYRAALVAALQARLASYSAG
ncbi:heme-dependent oxidative N-demethylase family protein [Futiania mangrovi]|uniref:DUF3445 domain-containing protein n=1 Tax=Futiania mangrovi TaxID=2959716 RepID=A0A9J6PCB3_9PROT|nr:DUF3445 domain-containing protein [Futiania mangrovii]MCP1335424.1 DUF3445 domain-containing protein [Futiania mangrovii]